MRTDSLYSTARIINSNISALNFNQTVSVIEDWIVGKESRYVCICNTHSLVTASNDAQLAEVLETADLCTPDGMPLVWALKMYGFTEQDRVDGPNLMLRLCEEARRKKYKIFLYGGKEETLEKLVHSLNRDYQGADIVGSYSPPFRELTEEEHQQVTGMINDSGAELVFVSLGCPKQEIWMYNSRSQINGVMIGVGAAFDFISGTIKRSPVFFQKSGLEWLYRLGSDPKRLWKRYAYNNPVYIYRFLKTFRKNKKSSAIANKSLERGFF
ncbi:WecB/TagA/CpsF family glycosyltransferase [Paenibacillus ihuae]|uniref:WecB/TagA/CpsF family glycosyltransferase n=1 Tax=Paenibacillus ihuae TaxID=1232431 RepID=UPI0006D59E46|nr:WecB/TagA/CpsF family glycosyltransferase [Paenibacillus ihuae]